MANKEQETKTKTNLPTEITASCRHITSHPQKAPSQRTLYTTSESGEILINATVVQDEIVAVARDLPWHQKHFKEIVTCLCLVIVLISSITVGVVQKVGVKRNVMVVIPSEMPSDSPSVAPSLDPRPTLVIVQERGRLLCGLGPEYAPGREFRRDMCRAIAAVVLGNPDRFEDLDVSKENGKHYELNRGAFDVQIFGDTHTVQREVMDHITFSTPYNYDGASYTGDATFVNCAYQKKRYDECQNLHICVKGSNIGDYIEKHFSPEFYTHCLGWDVVFANYANGTCNVIAAIRQPTVNLIGKTNITNYVVGNETFTNEPKAIVTRSDESEWSDIVNWVLQAIIYGEAQGLVQDSSLCDNDAPVAIASKLRYLNAVYCVGNYKEIKPSGSSIRSDMTMINNGTAMLYVTPFGEIYDEYINYESGQLPDSPVGEFMGSELQCGIVVQNGCEDGNITAPTNLCGMGVNLCTTLAASIYNGHANAVNFTVFADDRDALIGLTDGTVHVVFGIQANFEADFGTESIVGATFSMPYYYGNETLEEGVSVYPAVTSDNSPSIFSSYVNCIILATIHAAAEGITQTQSADMPPMTLFGMYHVWSLKDAISVNGNYDEIYVANFGNIPDEDRGRNVLNKLQGPQLFYNPGL